MNYKTLIFNVREQTAGKRGYFFLKSNPSCRRSKVELCIAQGKFFYNQRVKQSRQAYIFTDSLTMSVLYLLVITKDCRWLKSKCKSPELSSLQPIQECIKQNYIFLIFYCDLNANKCRARRISPLHPQARIRCIKWLLRQHSSLVRGSSWGFRPSWARKPVVGAVRGAEEFPAAGRMSSESAVCKLLPAMPNPS